VKRTLSPPDNCPVCPQLRRILRPAVLALLAGSLISAGPLRAQQETLPAFALKSGDRVVFYGDSITAQRLYTRFIEDFVVSRYPQMHVDFYNAGVSGDTVEGGDAGDMQTRVSRDVVPWHPTMITIMLGMNDGRYTTVFPANFAAYKSGYQKLVDDLKTKLPDAHFTLIQPSPYDEVAHPPAISGYNDVMVRYGDFLAQLGAQMDVPVANFNQAVTDTLRAGVRIDPRMAGSLLPDRIHPAPAGHWIMAAALVRAWHLSPIVSSVALDASTNTVVHQQNTTVSALTGAPTSLHWTQLDKALPLPLELNDSMTQFLLETSDIGSLDQQLLRVTGLSAPSYTLTIDDQKIGTFSREELVGGINLALFQTPMEQQAKSIDWTSEDRSKLSGARFDLITEGDKIPGEGDALRTLDTLDAKLMSEEYQNAQPKSHTFTLTAGQGTEGAASAQ
jgi:lysophospholipase L1-like esterase